MEGKSKRKCLFCDSSNLSNEHIIAQWLLKELNIIDQTVIMFHANFIGDKLSERKHTFSKLVNGLVCKECNSGWMSQLEGDVQEHVTNIMNFTNYFSQSMDWLCFNQACLSKWAFKNAILLNYAVNYRKLVPLEHFKSLYNDIIPKGVHIDIGFTANDDIINWRQSPGIMAIRPSETVFNPENFNQNYKVSFQFKHLLVKVVFYKSDIETFYENDGAVAIYPEIGKKGDFSPFESIDDFDIKGVIQEYKK